MFWKIKYHKHFNSPTTSPKIESVDSMEFLKDYQAFLGKLADCKFSREVQRTKNSKDSPGE